MAASFLGLPVPFLIGSALVSAALGIFGFAPRQVPASISIWARITIAVLIGASIQIELLDRLPEIGLAAALVPVQVALVLAAGSVLLRRITNMTPSERLLGALPGGFGSVILSVESLGHDVRRITMYHAIRVLAVITLVPLSLAWGLSVDGAGAPAARIGVLDLSAAEASLFLLTALAGWALARVTRLPGGPILLPLVLAIAVELTVGLPDIPSEAIPAAQIVLGSLVGFRFAEGGLATLRDALWTGVLLMVVVLITSLAPVAVLHFATDTPLGLGILAFAPGRRSGDQRAGALARTGSRLCRDHPCLAHGDRSRNAALPASLDGAGGRRRATKSRGDCPVKRRDAGGNLHRANLPEAPPSAGARP